MYGMRRAGVPDKPGKAKSAADNLSRFPRQSRKAEDIFRAADIQVPYRLQSSPAKTSLGWKPSDLLPPAILVDQSKLVRSGSFESQLLVGRNVPKGFRPQPISWSQLGPLLSGPSLSGLSLLASRNLSEANLSPSHQVFICGTHTLPVSVLGPIWSELATKVPYIVDIGSMRNEKTLRAGSTVRAGKALGESYLTRVGPIC